MKRLIPLFGLSTSRLIAGGINRYVV